MVSSGGSFQPREVKLSSISFKLLYDTDKLTYVKSKSLSGNGAMSVVNPNIPGLFQYAFVSPNGSLITDTTPLLTLWFTVADGLPDGTQIRFAFSEAIKADSVTAGSYVAQKRSVGAQLFPFTVGNILYGDANCDGAVTPADASHILRALVGLETLTDQGLTNASVDGENAISAQDAALVLRRIVGLIARFPVEE